ncbi:MAG: AcrR family transcriptional regulator [Myxococcota bacterium]|jgi:AcrR family transcriptional regulator
MARTRSPDRYASLVSASIQAFIEANGYRRAQVEDVASAMGVAKGTVYLYAKSKAALFDLAVRHADDSTPPPIPAVLPVPTPAPGQTVAYLRQRMADAGRFPRLLAATESPGSDITAELCGIVEELYDTVAANRVTIRLINTAARDLPELGGLWFDGARAGLHRRLTDYLDERVAAGSLPAPPSTAAAARMIIESTLWFAVHRAWDPRPDGIPDDLVRATITTGLVRSLLGDS